MNRLLDLPRLLALARPFARAPLVGEAAWRRIEALPDRYGRTILWGALECRLRAGDDRVDLALNLPRRSGWPRDLLCLWLELDDGREPAIPFAGFVEARRDPPSATLGLVAADALVAGLPEGSVLLHVASLAARGEDAVRVVVSVPRAAAAPWVSAQGWPGEGLPTLLDELGAFHSHVNLSLDLRPAIGPRLGIECFYPTSPRDDPRWGPVFRVARDRAGADPERLGVAADWVDRSPERRRQLQVKVVVEPGRELEAKAYLAFRGTARLSPRAE